MIHKYLHIMYIYSVCVCIYKTLELVNSSVLPLCWSCCAARRFRAWLSIHPAQAVSLLFTADFQESDLYL